MLTKAIKSHHIIKVSLITVEYITYGYNDLVYFRGLQSLLIEIKKKNYNTNYY